MESFEKIKGRALGFRDGRLYIAKGSDIIEAENLQKRNRWPRLPVSSLRNIAMKINTTSRALRLGVHHLVFSDSHALALVNRTFFLVTPNGYKDIGRLTGSRPMVMCAAEDSFYYGEYRSNPERSAVKIYKLRAENEVWEEVWRFEGVRHIHGVMRDPYSGAIWVTTGDTNKEAAIWRTHDDFNTLEKITGGTQQQRAVQLLFTPSYVYFGSDTPLERNGIYRLHRNTFRIEQVAEVNGSVFYGARVGSTLFFSTAVEPSTVNTSRFAEVWRSRDGSNWDRILYFKKDKLPMKYFQYGQVLFPYGLDDSAACYVTPFGTDHHGHTFRIPI